MANYERINWEDYPSTDTPLDSENLNKMDAAIDAINREVQQARENIEENADQVELAHNRIDSLIALPDGSTTADAELVDARIGYDNTQYSSLGAAIRGQVEDLHDALDDATDELNERIDNLVPGLSDTAKIALLDCFTHVTWDDEHGQDYYDALEAALYAEQYPKITATFNSGSNIIYTDDSIDSLKQYLTVRYYETRESTGTVVASTDYVLSGRLVEGSSNVLVSYDALTASFTIDGVVDFYNIWEWRSTVTGVGQLMRDNAPGIEHIVGGVKRGVSFVDDNIATNNRRGFSVRKGKYPMKENTTGNPTSFYPVPIPKTATKLTATITPATQLFASYVFEYVPGSNVDGWDYILRAPSQISWHTGQDVVTFEASDNLFVSFNCRASASNPQYTDATEPSLTIVFE